MATPHRFHTKRQLWPYAGLGVIQRTSAEQEIVDGYCAGTSEHL